MNDPSNLSVLYWFYHRMLHAGLIGVSGKAPAELEWRRPKVMETVTERHERLAEIDVGVFADFDIEASRFTSERSDHDRGYRSSGRRVSERALMEEDLSKRQTFGTRSAVSSSRRAQGQAPTSETFRTRTTAC